MRKLVKLCNMVIVNDLVEQLDAQLLSSLDEPMDKRQIFSLRDKYRTNYNDIFVIWNFHEDGTVTCEYTVSEDHIKESTQEIRILSCLASKFLEENIEMRWQ